MVAFAPNDPAFLENPYPFYEMGRALSPLLLADRGVWLVFGYDDVVRILKDHTTWSSFTPRPGMDLEAQRQSGGPTMLGADPPAHTRLRGLVSQAFTPRMVEQLEPRIRELSADLLDPVVPSGRLDLIEALAFPLPVIVIAEILGVPPEDRDLFKRWSDEIVASLGVGVTGQEPPLTSGTVEELRDYLQDMAEQRRRAPKVDLISGLVTAELEGDRLTPAELIQMLVLLLVAGNETTTNLIGNAAIAFMEHPDQLARLRRDPSLLPSAIEEVLRFYSPVQATVRRAACPAEIAGKAVEPNQLAFLWLGAANRDPAVFPEPGIFDVGRNPNRHLAFGMGIHFCLGAPLARLEARLALETFLARTSDFARVDDRPLPRVPTFIMRGVTSLPIEVVPA